MPLTRRSFLGRAAASAAVTPFILPSHIWAADTKPNSRLTMAFIGMGTQNSFLLGTFLGFDTQVVAVCDVDTTRRNGAQRRIDEHYQQAGRGGKCAAYVDFRKIIERKDIDAVSIATPDHWHAIITLAALRAGKDVYCEKPLTHNIHEAIEVLRAVDANHRVLQTGSMQRSMTEFRVACELVRNGAIGRVTHVECSFGNPGIPYDLPEEPMEPGLDWNFWLGPAPVCVYNSELSPRGMPKGFPNWRNYREFGGGMVTDWGAHQLDIAQWGLGMDASGPVEILPPAKPDAKRGAKLVYANGITVEHKDGFGVDFFGTEGRVQVNRGVFTFTRDGQTIASFTNKPEKKAKSDKNAKKDKKAKKDKTSNSERRASLAAELQKVQRQYLKDVKDRLYLSKNHLGDFLDCVKSRAKPITSEQVGARSAICCHLMNQAYYHGQKIKWDPAKFEFVDGTGDPKWLTRDYRSPWSV